MGLAWHQGPLAPGAIGRFLGWSWRTGVWHTCVTPLPSGDVTYCPQPLEPPAGGEALICRAQPGTDLVLDT
jgi:hypothetical protein